MHESIEYKNNSGKGITFYFCELRYKKGELQNLVVWFFIQYYSSLNVV